MRSKYILLTVLVFFSGCDGLMQAATDELQKENGTYMDPKLLAQAESGEATAQYLLGDLYITKAKKSNSGNEITEFTTKGLSMLEKSAASGNLNAMYRLGTLYGYGELFGGELCVARLSWCSDKNQEEITSRKLNEERGLKFLIYAAENGHVEAANRLSVASNQSSESKRYWLTIAAKNGDYNARVILHGEAQVNANTISGHEAGREWASDNGITDDSECNGDSQSFNDGCAEQVEDNLLETAKLIEQHQYEESIDRKN